MSGIRQNRIKHGSIDVLHVDDNPQFTDLTATSLTAHEADITLHTETDPRAGLEYFQQHDIECIVSDYQMPDINGLEFLNQVRQEDTDIPFILFTGHGSEEVASEAISAGVTDYLQKGHGVEQFELLANRIEQSVQNRRIERALDATRKGYEKLIETAPDAIFVVDAKTGTILDVNRAAERLLGRDREHLRGKHQTDLHPPDERDRYERIFNEHAGSTGIIRDERELVVVHADGHRIPVEISAASFEIHDQLLVQGIFRDLSNRTE